MQVSWIDPDEIRRLVAQLAGPERMPDSSAWELHTQPIAVPIAAAHGHLLDAPSSPLSPARPSESAPHSAELQNGELWRIRERLRLLREKAQKTGVIAPSEGLTKPASDAASEATTQLLDAPPVAPVASPSSLQESIVQPPAEPPQTSAPSVTETDPAETSEPGNADSESFQLPSVEAVAWATREDKAPEPAEPSVASAVTSAPLPAVSAQRLESLGPMLAEAAMALAAHARQQTQRLGLERPSRLGSEVGEASASPLSPLREPAPEAPAPAASPQPGVEPATSVIASTTGQVSPAVQELAQIVADAMPRLTLRSSKPFQAGELSGIASATSAVPASPLSLRVPPHLVSRERQPATAEIELQRNVPPGFALPEPVLTSKPGEVEPLFGPLVAPRIKLPEPVAEAPAAVADEPSAASPTAMNERSTEALPLVEDSSAATVVEPPAEGLSVTREDDIFVEPITDKTPELEVAQVAPNLPVADSVAPALDSANAAGNPCSEATPEIELSPPSAVASEPIESKPEAESPSVPVEATLPPLLPFRVPSLGLSDRLAALADWACKGLATDEVLLVDDYGDVLWGGQGQTALVLSAMMAWHTAQRSAPVSAIAQQRRIDKPLACGRHLTVIPARTRYGVVSLAAIRPQRIADLDANRIHDALMMSVEATGLA